jgi:hypothetical protein
MFATSLTVSSLSSASMRTRGCSPLLAPYPPCEMAWAIPFEWIDRTDVVLRFAFAVLRPSPACSGRRSLRPSGPGRAVLTRCRSSSTFSTFPSPTPHPHTLRRVAFLIKSLGESCLYFMHQGGPRNLTGQFFDTGLASRPAHHQHDRAPSC